LGGGVCKNEIIKKDMQTSPAISGQRQVGHDVINEENLRNAVRKSDDATAVGLEQ
jgi:type III secretory pathway component EscU